MLVGLATMPAAPARLCLLAAVVAASKTTTTEIFGVSPVVQHNDAIHMAAVTQIRHRHSDGRAYYDRKVAEGKSGKEALRAPKRRIGDALYRQLEQVAQRAAAAAVTGPGGQTGNGYKASVTGSHPEHRLFGEATRGPAKTLRQPTRTRPRVRRSRPLVAIRRRS
jgi:hypothetical protein